MYICYSEYDKRYRNGEKDTLNELIMHMNNWGIQFGNLKEYDRCEEVEEKEYYLLERDIANEQYAVIYMTKNFVEDIMAVVELNIIYRLFRKNKIRVYTFIDNVDMDKLPKRLEWIKLTYNFIINSTADMYMAIYNVMERCLSDKVKCNKYTDWRNKLPDIELDKDDYVMRIIDVCNEIVNYGMAMQLTALYMLYNYIRIKLDDYNNDIYTDKVMKGLICYTEVCVPTTAIQLKIAERCITVLVNCFYEKHT